MVDKTNSYKVVYQILKCKNHIGIWSTSINKSLKKQKIMRCQEERPLTYRKQRRNTSTGARGGGGVKWCL